MGAPYPVLANGLATSQGIWDTVTSAVVPVGTRGALEDGRVFYYSRNSGIALIAGQNVMAELQTAQYTEMDVPTSASGATSVSVTLGSTAVTLNEYAGGYMCIIDDTGEGITYKIDSHPVALASAACVLTLVDPIKVTFGANTTVQMVKNPWMDVVVAVAAQAHLSVGISQVAVGSGAATPQYFWTQTWGISCAWQDTNNAIGLAMTSGTTEGQFETIAAGDQPLCINMWTAVEGEYNPVFLTVAP